MPRKKNVEKPELKFLRLKNTFEDLIGYVTYHDEYVLIDMPLRIEIDTIFEEGRQILSMQEYLPQSVIDLRQVEINTHDIMFITPVREEFVEQYEYVSDFFYNNVSRIKGQKTVDLEKNKETLEKTQKVVSILEAMANKKDKPVH